MNNIELLNKLSKSFCGYDFEVNESQTYSGYLFAAAYYNVMVNQTQERIKQKDICKRYNLELTKYCRLLNNCENGIFKNDSFQMKYEAYCTIVKEFSKDYIK